MSIVFDVATIIFSVIFAIKATKNLKNGMRYTFFCLFFFIFVIPVILDYLIGFPDYVSGFSTKKYYGFIYSQKDAVTRILYDLFLIINELILFYYSPRRIVIGKSYKVHQRAMDDVSFLEMSKKTIRIAYVLSFFGPILAIMFGFGINILFTFGWRESNLFQYHTMNHYSTVEKLSYVGVVSSLCLLFVKAENEKNWKKVIRIIISAFTLYMNMCMESKRSIIFFALIMVLIIKLSVREREKSYILIILGALLLVLVVITSTVYVKMNFRGYSDFESVYRGLRIDLFRDDTVKMVIYSFLGKNIDPIISYPFQSYINQIASIFPLDILTGIKMIVLPNVGYNTFLTSSLIGADISVGQNFMTTSMFDEVIANFGILGFFLGGMFVVRVSNRIDNMKPLDKILTSAAIILMFFYSLNYIMYYLEIAFIVVWLLKRVRVGGGNEN